MKKSFLGEGSVELTNRFSNTFIANCEGNVKTPIFVRNIPSVNKENGTLEVVGVTVCKGQWSPTAKSYSEDSLDYFPPVPGFRNNDVGAFYYDLVPMRHKSRGLTKGQVRCTFINFPKAQEKSVDSADFCTSLFNPHYVPIHDAIMLVRSKTMTSCAFSTKFAFSLVKGYKNMLVLYKRKPVGIYLKEGDCVMLPPAGHFVSDELSSFITCVKR